MYIYTYIVYNTYVYVHIYIYVLRVICYVLSFDLVPNHYVFDNADVGEVVDLAQSFSSQ